MTDSDLDQTPGQGSRLTQSLDRLADALAGAAAASERYARRLMWATWTLVFATLVLAAVTVAERYFALPPIDDEGTVSAAANRPPPPRAELARK
jgi:hypothetical protein